MEQNYMNAQLFLDVYNRKEISPELLVRIVKEYQRSESLSQKSNFIYLISEIMRYAYTKKWKKGLVVWFARLYSK